MRLTVTTANDDLFTLEVPGDIEIENLKAYCEVESGIPSDEIVLKYNGNALTDGKKTVTQCGIGEGDMLFLQRARTTSTGGVPPMDWGNVRTPGSGGQGGGGGQGRGQGNTTAGGERQVDPYVLREMLRASPHEIALLRQNNPELADALNNENPEQFVNLFRQQAEEKRRRDAEQMALLSGDPFDPEVQRRIAEAIQQENVNANMEAAMEFAPESFGQVHMLYINCKVNGHSVKAFVDSGAQMTIMSKECADRCNIGHLMDRRWAGIAKGVGVQRILGRVHMCQISINTDHLQCSFSILEDQPMDMLLGLDMLKRHQCCIDLKKNTLVIGTTGTETPFLPESELPEHARLNRSVSSSEQERDMAEAMLQSQNERQGTVPSPRPAASRGPIPSNSGESSAAGSTTPQFSQDAINRLMREVGGKVTREQAISELTKANGNEQLALMNLLAKSINFPKK